MGHPGICGRYELRVEQRVDEGIAVEGDDVFDLLADARAEIGAREDYIRSVRDFLMARSALDAALLGPAPTDSRTR